MNLMESIVRLIHARVQKYPFLKEVLKKAYQMPFVLFSSVSHPENLVLRIENAFLGFHDINPWSAGGNELLVHKSTSTSRERLTGCEEVEVGLFSSDSSVFEKVATTKAFNWQQGSRAQWLGGTSEVIFNCIENNSLVSKKWCSRSKKMTALPAPVYSVTRCGKKFVSTNFSIIEKFMPGYGYSGEFIEPDNPGSFAIRSVKDAKLETRIGFDQLRQKIRDLPECQYFISHFQFSPNGRKLAFLVRVPIRKNWYHTYFMSFDLELKRLVWIDSIENATHFSWVDDQNLLVFMRRGNLSKFCRVNANDASVVAPPELAHLLDGHPFSNGRHMIIDSYPDKKRRQNLYLYDLEKANLRFLFSVYSPFKYSGYHRIDLHPKINTECDLIAFDAGDLGRQSVCICSVRNN
jgi:hypothetical protein